MNRPGKSDSSTPFKHAKLNSIKKKPIDVSHIVLSKNIKMTAAPAKPKTIDMICEAITEIGTLKKGASYPAIKNFVMGKYSDQESTRLQTNLKKAIVRGVETGVLERPSASKTAKGATGFFVISKTKQIKKENGTKVAKNPRAKKPTEPVSDSEVTINKGGKGYKGLKQNLSDTEIDIKLKKEKLKKKTVASEKSEDKIKPSKMTDKVKALPIEKTKTNKVTKTNTKDANILKEQPNVTKVISGPIAKKKLEKKEPIKEKMTEKKATEKSDKKQPKTLAKKKGTN